jgi:hypothetical protein
MYTHILSHTQSQASSHIFTHNSVLWELESNWPHRKSAHQGHKSPNLLSSSTRKQTSPGNYTWPDSGLPASISPDGPMPPWRLPNPHTFHNWSLFTFQELPTQDTAPPTFPQAERCPTSHHIMHATTPHHSHVHPTQYATTLPFPICSLHHVAPPTGAWSRCCPRLPFPCLNPAPSTTWLPQTHPQTTCTTVLSPYPKLTACNPT